MPVDSTEDEVGIEDGEWPEAGMNPDSAPSPPGSPYFAGSDTSYDFDRHSEDALSADGHSYLSPQPSLYSLTDSLRAQTMMEEFGKPVNSTNTIYKISADESEAERIG